MSDASADSRTPRRRVLKAGLICFNARHATLPCQVRDLSETGAKLVVSGSLHAPDTFELHIELDGLWVPCEVVWRRGDTVGVRFTGPKQIQPPSRVQVVSQPTAKPSLRRTRP